MSQRTHCTGCVSTLKVDFTDLKVTLRDPFKRETLTATLHHIDVAGRPSPILVWVCPSCGQPGATMEVPNATTEV